MSEEQLKELWFASGRAMAQAVLSSLVNAGFDTGAAALTAKVIVENALEQMARDIAIASTPTLGSA